MSILLTGIGLWVAAFVVHWLLWRIRVPARAVVSLLAIDAGVLAVGLLVIHRWEALAWVAPNGIWPHLHLLVFYVAACFVYVINYSGLEEDSPSFTMVKFVELAGERGRARAEFDRIITDELIVHSRLRALVAGGLVQCEEGRYRLTSRGVFWNRMFGLWRSLLGIPEGG